MPDVHYEKIDHVALIILDRPEQANSLSFKVMREELPAAWQRARDDRDVRAIVFTASGDRYFCTGVDLRDPGLQRRSDGAGEPMDLGVTGRQNDVWKPIITAVNGHCVGGGLMFVGDSDIVIASENARFSNTGVSLGLLAPVGPVVLARKIPFEAVMRMLITGRHESIDAQRALQLGLVSEVTTPEALRDTALDIARKVASNSPAAVEQAVRAMWETLEMPLSEALAASLKRSGSLRGHPDSSEGPRAWAEKREPQWRDEPVP
ncbi:MAG: enoyl-CoA hydratase/isomerase family protein [Dehalococcoidia bacterium]